MGKKTDIKYANTLTEYEPWQIQELLKCKNDPIYFIKKYVKIQRPGKGIINFDMYDFQETIIKSFQKYRNTLLLLPRQSGKCGIGLTSINICGKVNCRFKRLLLKLLDRNLYDQIYNSKNC